MFLWHLRENNFLSAMDSKDLYIVHRGIGNASETVLWIFMATVMIFRKTLNSYIQIRMPGAIT